MEETASIGGIHEGAAPHDPGWRIDHAVDRIVLIADMVGSMALRQAGWDAALPLIRMHNVVITDTVRALRHAGAECDTLEYIGDAVVISFKNPDEALKCALGIQRDLARWSEDHEVERIQARIAVAFGEVLRVRYRDEEAYDWQGRPIDIAAKLISNVARPDQILVDETAARRMTPSTFGVKLRPKETGEELPIESEAKNVRVFEVVPKNEADEGERLANRRRLIKELTEVSRQTHELKLQLASLMSAIDEAGATGRVQRAESELKATRFEIRELDQAWRRASEVEKTRAVACYRAIEKRWEDLNGVWSKEEHLLRTRGDDERRAPAGRCHQAASRLNRCADELDKEIHRSLEAIWPQA